jgi:hypothetical protein
MQSCVARARLAGRTHARSRAVTQRTMLDGAGARPSTCCGREDCASVFEPCPCNSPVWERSWTTLDLPADLWRSSTSTALGCGQQCCGSRCSAVVLLLFRLAALVFCATIWVVAYSPTTELRLANDLESFTMQVRDATVAFLVETSASITILCSTLCILKPGRTPIGCRTSRCSSCTSC